jgi:hypothetical protein
MSAPKLDFEKLISQIPEHLGDLPTESARPIEHFRLDANGYWNLLRYFERKTQEGYPGPRERHVLRLRSMVVFGLVETFERFLKETAAACIDQLAGRVIDDRFSVLSVNARAVAAHFEEKTLGKALCEADTWLNSSEINSRFGKLLADPFQLPSFKLFPDLNQKSPKSDPDLWRRTSLDILWQLRHSIAHNAGVITRSDAAKLRLLRRSPVHGQKLLQLTNGDVWYVKLFLDDLASWANARIAARLAEVLTSIHVDDSTLFVPSDVADELAQLFREQVVVGGAVGTPR